MRRFYADRVLFYYVIILLLLYHTLPEMHNNVQFYKSISVAGREFCALCFSGLSFKKKNNRQSQNAYLYSLY